MEILKPNSYIRVIKIKKDEIDKLDVFMGKQPYETIESVFNRLNEKPDVMLNGNLFAMNNGNTCGCLVDEGKLITEGYYTTFGMAIYGDETIEFNNHSLTNKTKLRDFMGGGPSLIIDGKIYLDNKGLDYGFINYRHPRSAIGSNKDYFFIVTVDGRRSWAKGMTCKELANYMLSIGCTDAINLDGGGSTKCCRNNNGKIEYINSPLENRKIDNMLLVYLKKNIVPKPNPSGNIKVGDKVLFKGGPVYTYSCALNYTCEREKSLCKVTNIANGSHKYHCVSTDYKGVYGWVDEDKLTLVDDTTVPDDNSTNVITKKVKTSLNIRNIAGIYGSRIVGSYKKGDVVTVYEKKKTTDGATWVRTERGWVNSYYLG